MHLREMAALSDEEKQEHRRRTTRRMLHIGRALADKQQELSREQVLLCRQQLTVCLSDMAHMGWAGEALMVLDGLRAEEIERGDRRSTDGRPTNDRDGLV